MHPKSDSINNPNVRKNFATMLGPVVQGSAWTVGSPAEDPFGVLGAHTQSFRAFSEDDVNFLQAVANVLAMAIERKEAQEKLEEVRETERSRIARDLHDEALQDLAQAKWQAQFAQAKLQEPELVGRMSRLSAALGRVEYQVRAAIYDMRLSLPACCRIGSPGTCCSPMVDTPPGSQAIGVSCE